MRLERPIFRIKYHLAGLAMMVFLPAQRPAVYAGRRSCTWVYETTNETERHGRLTIMRHIRTHTSRQAELAPARRQTGLALGCPLKEA